MNQNGLLSSPSFALDYFQELLLGRRRRDGKLGNLSFHLDQAALPKAAGRTLSQVALDFGRRLFGMFGRQQTPLYDRAVHELSLSCS